MSCVRTKEELAIQIENGQTYIEIADKLARKVFVIKTIKSVIWGAAIISVCGMTLLVNYTDIHLEGGANIMMALLIIYLCIFSEEQSGKGLLNKLKAYKIVSHKISLKKENHLVLKKMGKY